jgi:hypothetical protein
MKLVILVGCLLAGLLACRSSERNLAPKPAATPAAGAAQATPNPDEAQVISDRRKGFFDHSRKEHRVKPDGPVESCASCHQRDAAKPADAKLNQPGRTAQTWLPFHNACTICHGAESFQQTAADTLEKNPMCAACHNRGITRDNQALLIGYPARNSEFGLAGIAGEMPGFSHRTHTDKAKMGDDADKANCRTCHQFDGRGVKASFPRHEQCFSCHTHQAEQKLSDCSTCHITAAQAVSFARGPERALKLFSFRHSPAHLKAASCDRCHRTVEPAQPKAVDILQISTGQGQRHSSACWSCHQQAQEPVCTKCHTSPPAVLRASLWLQRDMAWHRAFTQTSAPLY